MKAGDTVRVSGASGSVTAHVIDTRLPEELPDLPSSATLARLAREALTELGVINTALFEYEADDATLRFFAMRFEPGEWRDLQGNLLEIEEADDPQPRLFEEGHQLAPYPD